MLISICVHEHESQFGTAQCGIDTVRGLAFVYFVYASLTSVL